MKTRIVLFLICSFLSANSLLAKKIGMNISYAQFQDDKGDAYLEFYFSLDSRTIDYVKTGNSYTGGIEITLSVAQNDQIIAADKFRLMDQDRADTNSLGQVLVNQVRFALDKGTYTMDLKVQDVNHPEEVYNINNDTLDVGLGGTDLTFSDLVFLDSFSKAKKPSEFSKSGYDLVPMVSSGNYYFSEQNKQLAFYTEVYNSDVAFGADGVFAVKYYIKDYNSQEAIFSFASLSKKSSAKVTPVLANFNIEKLPTGSYEVVVDVLNRKGETVLSKSNFFFRKNNIVNEVINLENISQAEAQASFAGRLGGGDSLYQAIDFLYPISTDRERNYQKRLMRERSIKDMTRYIYIFWKEKDPNDPEQAWADYRKEVLKCNRLYSARLEKGYKTDRGRVFLTYGPPTTVDKHPFTVDYFPYEIWQFDRASSPYITTQTNIQFIFGELSNATNDYQLVHSTAIGETNNRRWKYRLYKTGNAAGSDIDEENPSGDPRGSLLENNIIFKGSGGNNR